MVKRIEEGNSVSFDWTVEREYVETRIRETLATYNPNSPIVIDRIMDVVEAWVGAVEGIWNGERVIEATRGADAMRGAFEGVVLAALDGAGKQEAAGE